MLPCPAITGAGGIGKRKDQGDGKESVGTCAGTA